MQVVRTIIWVLILVGVVLFSFFNWRDVEVMIWDNLVLETKVPALVIISFLLGFLPTWLYARGVIWSLNRKIRSLEIAAKASSVSAAARESDREEAERTEPVEPEPESAPESHEETTAGAPAPHEETRLSADEPQPAENAEEPAPQDAASQEAASADAQAAEADETPNQDKSATT
ncbi:LapA family protein [Citromicrobium bathyomarinum]|jgi:hypothetical protein|uniref:LapA family protein n=1 Tax=Sphingomonadales TaxID=204457 RepID=UPI000C43B662|nr:LapA family protein [Citromicrobium sp.]MBO81945.1 hypothetical protein [Citromicrobium sp.]|tara:strand:+ start:2206 stop:2730 length:525 start_codon:yes stop_codon:yes gene_type:complete